MNLWPLPITDSRTAPAARRFDAMAAVVGQLGAPGFPQATLQALNRAGLQAASWSVYQLAAQRTPRLHLSASVGVADTTRDCFSAYQQGLYRADRSFDTVAAGQAAVLRMHADDAPSSQHRDAIYRRHGMLERLSVVQRGDDGALLAINLYHHAHQGLFAEAELAGFTELAPLLLAAVQRHLALSAALLAASQAASQAALLAALPVMAHPLALPAADGMAQVDAHRAPAAGPCDPGGPRQALLARCPALTTRELDVCERLLRGWTYDGIAADLGLSVATVKTYRARAFGRLGLHFKSELFAAFLARH
jgi:DNA-binding CsgD family transcriptional regulator